MVTGGGGQFKLLLSNVHPNDNDNYNNDNDGMVTQMSRLVGRQCQVLTGAGSQLVVSVFQHTLAGSISKAFNRVAAELGEAVCVYLGYTVP